MKSNVRHPRARSARSCGLRLLRTEGDGSRRVNVIAACGTEGTRTTNVEFEMRVHCSVRIR